MISDSKEDGTLQDDMGDDPPVLEAVLEDGYNSESSGESDDAEMAIADGAEALACCVERRNAIIKKLKLWLQARNYLQAICDTDSEGESEDEDTEDDAEGAPRTNADLTATGTSNNAALLGSWADEDEESGSEDDSEDDDDHGDGMPPLEQDSSEATSGVLGNYSTFVSGVLGNYSTVAVAVRVEHQLRGALHMHMCIMPHNASL